MFKEYTVNEFLNKEFLQYSNYKVIQQLPGFIDNLSQTARKELWVLSSIPNKKIKTIEIYSLIYNETAYLHGDMSAYNVFENLAADFKNNINLISAKANFGYRTNPHAAAARYAAASYSNLAKYIFLDIDKKIRKKQYLEGQEIEPLQLYPIIPIGLINGFSGIAVGFSSKILPRDANVIINIIYSVLNRTSKKIPAIIKPKFPYFNGEIKEGENLKQFIFYGKINKIPTKSKKYGYVEITEVPPNYDREKMINILNKLIDKNIINSFDENCIKNDFYFKVKLPIETYEKPEDELMQLFNLIQKESENLTFIDLNDEKKIREYDSIAVFLKDWIIKRLSIYKERKEYILNEILRKIKINENKINFIESIFNKEIIIEKRKKNDILTQLESKGFLKVDNSYDYLLKMPLWNLTEEKIESLTNDTNQLKKDYKTLIDKEIRLLWLEDLDNLKKAMNK